MAKINAAQTTLSPLLPSNCTPTSQTEFSGASRLTEEDNPDSPLCLLNMPSSEYCQYWRVTALILLRNDAQSTSQTNDIKQFLSTITEYCDEKSELVMFTPQDLNSKCLDFNIGSDDQKLYFEEMDSSQTTVQGNDWPGMVLENMLTQLMNCTVKESFTQQEAGVAFLFTDFTCEELCDHSNLTNLITDLLYRLTYHNKYVARIYLLSNFTDEQVNCLSLLFAACSIQNGALCGIRVLPNRESFMEKAETTHTCAVPKNKITTLALILAIGIPCVLVTVIVILLSVICIRHRLKKKWFHFWFENNRKKDITEQAEGHVNNDYLDFDRIRVKDLWEIDPVNLEVQNELLGTGAFASVYKGKLSGTVPLLHIHSSLKVQIEGRLGSVYDVAVKKLPNHADDTAKHDFRQEMDFMKTLGYHLHIISLIGCVTSKIQPLIVVEYAHHGDLLKFMRTHKHQFISDKRASCPINTSTSLTLKDLISFSWQISDGMVFLSSNKYIHRDLAARNILLTKNLVAKIGDFGLCRELNSMLYTAHGGRLPIKWMAIESLRYYEYSTKSDIWSFGVLLFEIFSLGEAPYSTVQPIEMPEHLEKGNRLHKPDHCPDEFYDMMKKCWAEAPDGRPTFTQIREEIRMLLNSHDEQYGYLPIDMEQNGSIVVEEEYESEEEKDSISRL